jgi:hypothetical protein
MPEKLTPEEYDMLANSPADAPHLVEGDEKAPEPPEGVVEGDDES